MDDVTTHLHRLIQQTPILALPDNLTYRDDFRGAGGRGIAGPHGHVVGYGADGERLCLLDPNGHVLHECAWRTDRNGRRQMAAARLRLEWNQWIGILPRHLHYETNLDLSTRPDWRSITKDRLRAMAAQAMHLSLEHIRFFYHDEDIQIDAHGRATIHQAKDAFCILQDGDIERRTFMSCMTPMRWERIDYLPVVELFLSLLPGTGSATFELIRALYDDQQTDHSQPLRYRGLPPYPSEGAFRLFSQFFSPQVDPLADAFRLFMDPPEGREVLWLPSPAPPVRIMDTQRELCLTIVNGQVAKATRFNDTTGLPFHAPPAQGVAPCARTVSVSEGHVTLNDEGTIQRSPIALPPTLLSAVHSANVAHDANPTWPSWRSLFPNGVPDIHSSAAFSAVLLYPEDDTPIGERESHPFLFDYLEDVRDEDDRFGNAISTAKHVLVHECDGALKACVDLTTNTDYTVAYRWPEFAQKHAQTLWNACARTERWDRLQRVRFLPTADTPPAHAERRYDLLYWSPRFEHLSDVVVYDQHLRTMIESLAAGGVLCMAGTPFVETCVAEHSLTVICAEYVVNLPTYRMHQAILPRATLYPDLMVWALQKP